MFTKNKIQLVKQYFNCCTFYCTQAPYKFRLSDVKRGSGGRHSFSGIVATVFGASGFLGRYVCNRLGRIGSQIIAPYRGEPYDVFRLKVCGGSGQVLFQRYDLRDENSIRKALKYSNVAINLIGRDWETKNYKFEDVHIHGPALIARICREQGIEKLVHFSSLNVSENPDPIFIKNGSQFLRSKWLGEQAVLAEFPDATIFRPADIYGQEDRFLRFYAHLWRHQGHYMPLWKKGEHTFKQPVHCKDVAQGVVNAIHEADSNGKIYQAVGPRRYKLGELVDWFHRVMHKSDDWGYKRYDCRYDPFFRLRVSFTEMIRVNDPLGNLHWERLERESISDKVEKGVPTLEDLGINLTLMEDEVPWELRHRRSDTYSVKAAQNIEPVPSAPFINEEFQRPSSRINRNIVN